VRHPLNQTYQRVFTPQASPTPLHVEFNRSVDADTTSDVNRELNAPAEEAEAEVVEAREEVEEKAAAAAVTAAEEAATALDQKREFRQLARRTSGVMRNTVCTRVS
jgi:hypothetical protein